MPAPRSDRAAVVLCGGESARMGRPKALLPFGPEVLLQRVLRICGEVCGERIVVASPGQDLPALPAGVKAVRDALPGQGPLEGLAAGLAAASAPAAFAASCDAPFLVPALIERMFEALGEASAAQGVIGGRPEPLLAVYRTALADRAAARVREGKRRLVDLVEGERVALVPESALREVDPSLASFRACNTPEEYAAALREAGWGG